MTIDLDREAAAEKADGERMQGENWLADSGAPAQVAAYVAASELVDALSTGKVVELVKHGLDVDVAAVRDLAPDVLLKRARA
jgi:hypothetical protein